MRRKSHWSGRRPWRPWLHPKMNSTSGAVFHINSTFQFSTCFMMFLQIKIPEELSSLISHFDSFCYRQMTRKNESE
jgi:hypothetical protein